MSIILCDRKIHFRSPHVDQPKGYSTHVIDKIRFRGIAGRNGLNGNLTGEEDDIVSIFQGLDPIINTSLGIDETWIWKDSQLSFRHTKTLQELCRDRGRDVDGQALVHDLLDQVIQNWENASFAQKSVPPNPHNWRRRQNRIVDPDSTSDEVTLERIITQTTDGNWWNQIPVDHKLLGVQGHRIIDLVHRDGEFGRDFEVIELKIGDVDTPLSAAVQVLKYGVVYAFYRNRYEEIFSELPQTELLNANRLTLVVLAPWDFYQDFTACDWLARFESSLQEALLHISTTSGLKLPEMGFKFQSFPETFRWSAAMANDQQARKEVLWAVHNRVSVFTR